MASISAGGYFTKVFALLTAAAGLLVFGGSFAITGTTGSALVSGPGTRLEWIPDKATLVAGTVHDGRWDEASVGSNSFIFGTDSQANSNSFVWGLLADALGNVSLALGNQAQATGDSAVAVGPFTQSTQLYASAFGNHVTSSASGATVLGEWCSNSGSASTVICAGTPSTTYNFATPNKIGMVGETQMVSTSSTSIPLTILDNSNQNILAVASTTLTLWGGLTLPTYFTSYNLDGFTVGSYTGNPGYVDVQGGIGNGGVLIRKAGSATQLNAQLGRSLTLMDGSVTTTFARDQFVFAQQTGFPGGTFTLDQSGNLSTSGTAFIGGDITDNGHRYFGGLKPTVTSCGAGATNVGNDNAGIITAGAAPGASCSMTFATPWTNTPVCNFQDNQVTNSHAVTAVSSTGIVFSSNGNFAGSILYYHCDGYK